MDYIPREKCREGYVYRIRSRNLDLGIFHRKPGLGGFESGFIGIREKFGNLYLFTEYHHDDGAPFGTVYPESEVEKCPVEDLCESFGPICFKCRGTVDFVKNGNHGPGTGDWEHAGDPPPGCEKVITSSGRWGSLPNKALFDYLDQLSRRLFGKPLCWRCKENQHGRHGEISMSAKACECDDPACLKK